MVLGGKHLELLLLCCQRSIRCGLWLNINIKGLFCPQESRGCERMRVPIRKTPPLALDSTMADARQRWLTCFVGVQSYM